VRVEGGRQSLARCQFNSESLLKLIIVVIAILRSRRVGAGLESETEVVARELVEVVEGVLGKMHQVLCFLGW
jgi:hypothetical protein